MPTTRRQSSRVLRTASSTSRNTQRQPQQRRHARNVAPSPTAESPPPAAFTSSSSSAASHPLSNAATDPSGSGAASSTFDPHGRGSAKHPQNQKYLSAYEKLYTFAPTHEPVSEEASSHVIPTRELLERIRERLFQDVLEAVAREARDNDRLFQRLERVAPAKVVRIEEIRFEALDELKSFDSAVEDDPSNAEERAEACATKLQDYVDELHSYITWQDKTNDAFALGAMVMIIEEVVSRGSRGGPQMQIYEVLISDPPEAGEELRALSYIKEYTEDILTAYIDQLVYIVQQVERMVGRLKPRSMFARDLDTLIQPIRQKREEEKRQSEAPQRGQKRRESGLYEGAGAAAGQGGRTSSKRPSRR